MRDETLVADIESAIRRLDRKYGRWQDGTITDVAEAAYDAVLASGPDISQALHDDIRRTLDADLLRIEIAESNAGAWERIAEKATAREAKTFKALLDFPFPYASDPPESDEHYRKRVKTWFDEKAFPIIRENKGN